MADIMTEALLEMHYHHAIVDHFSSVFGANFLRLLKPSPQNEAWVGFDQGWTNSSVSTGELLDELRDAIQSNAASTPNFYIGYFMQFKVVRKMVRRSSNMPAEYVTPYYRVEILLDSNKRSGLSQHETLMRLASINNAFVCYACPMLFELEDIYAPANLCEIRCVDIQTAPTNWSSAEKHFITFQTRDTPNPHWCSDPSKGSAVGFQEWASPNCEFCPRKLQAKELRELLNTAVDVLCPRVISRKNTWNRMFMHDVEIAKHLPQSFTILEFSA